MLCFLVALVYLALIIAGETDELNEYEITHPDYKFNGTFSPTNEYEWPWVKEQVPTANPSRNPTSKSPTSKSPSTRKLRKKRKPTPRPTKRRRRTRPPVRFPTDSPDCLNGGCYEEQWCHNGCPWKNDGECDGK